MSPTLAVKYDAASSREVDYLIATLIEQEALKPEAGS
jgi:hypothetical protein